MTTSSANPSPYAQASPICLEAGLSVFPIKPGEKRPGDYRHGRWVGMSEWHRYSDRLPSEFEVEAWRTWPDAGIGMVTGNISRVVALDFDAGPPALREAIEQLIPLSPARKSGAKGYTAFYAFAGETSRKWKHGEEMVLELLSNGRQTVLPPTIHPDGMAYRWTGDLELAEAVMRGILPTLPTDFAARVDELIAAWGGAPSPSHSNGNGHARPALGSGSAAWREVNDTALANLDAWVLELCPEAKREANGSYRVAATWRGGDGPNVAIHANGIRDFAGDEGLTAIDLVMRKTGASLDEATDWLKKRLHIQDPEPPSFDALIANGLAKQAAKNDVPAPAPAPPTPTAPPAKPKRGRGRPRKQQPPEILALPSREYLVSPEALGPGPLSMLHQVMVETAPRPQPWLALGSALALLGTLCGHRYRTASNIRTNLYILAIAESGAGKEHPRRVAKEALYSSGLERHLGGTRLASGQGLLTALAREPRSLFLIDEFGIFIHGITDKRSPRYMQDIKDVLLQIYTSADQILPGAEKADPKHQRQDIKQPCCCLYGTTTPVELWNAVESSSVANGMMGRFLAFVSNDDAPERQKITTPLTLRKELLEAVRFVERGHPSRGNLEGMTLGRECAIEPYKVPIEPDAEAILDAYGDRVEQMRLERLGTNTAELVVRSWEHSVKLAMIRAVSDNPHDPRITAAAAKWSVAVTEHCLRDLAGEVESRMADNPTEARHKKLYQLVEEAGPEGIRKSALLRMTQGMTTREREDGMKTLQEAHYVVMEIQTTTRRPATIYKAAKWSKDEQGEEKEASNS